MLASLPVECNLNNKISVINLEKVYSLPRDASVHALSEINLNIRDGEFLCIVGPSGCGKTTLLRIMAGLEQQTGGTVTIMSGATQSSSGKPLSAMVFQEQSIFPWMNVVDNVSFGLQARGMKRAEARREVDGLLHLMGLKKFAKSYPHQLSGGMKQRASVARAFAVDPQILLMDEPFGALDEQTRIILQQELLRIWEGTQKTAVFITHSIDEALALGDRVVVMTARPGKIKAIIDVNIPRPRDVGAIRSVPGFNELYMQISTLLKDEVAK